VDGACLLATDDMTDAHIADATRVGIRRLKFLYKVDPTRRRELSQSAKEQDWSVGLHCGGTSVPGTQALNYDAIMDFLPTVLLHLNGGPTALATADIMRLVQESDLEIDLVMCGNPAQAISIATRLAEQGDWHRLGLGTDSPTKSGMVPVGLWYMIALLASVGGLPVDKLVAAASTAVATRYWKEDRSISVGAPATFICIDRPAGGTAETAMSALGQGDLPGIAGLFINGNFVGGEYNTPPSDRSLQRSQ
jgi:enamidase